MSKNKNNNDCPSHDREMENPIDSAEVKLEANGWVYFGKYTDKGYALFRARPDGLESEQLAQAPSDKWDKLTHIEMVDGWIHFKVITNYSVFDEESYEYNRYSTNATYKIKPGEALTKVTSFEGYRGTSN